jgi:hypothetical protein
MCSTAAQRIAEIGRAIDDLAVRAVPTPADADPIVARLAELWTLLAELDPEVARRLAGYQALSAHAELGRQVPRVGEPLPGVSCRRSRLRASHLFLGAVVWTPDALRRS